MLPAEPAHPSGDPLAALLYTSGTTARPKGVMHTHSTLQCLSDDPIAAFGPETFLRSVIATALCHISGLFILLPTMDAGGAVWIVPAFDPEAVLRTISESRATAYFGVPAHLNALVHHPGAERFDLRSLALCASGGDVLPLHVHDRFREVFGVQIEEGCGMTELIHSFNRPPDTRRPGSFGKPLESVRLRIVDDRGRDVPAGQIGELLAHSQAISPGYWNDPQATSDAVRNGWLHTGDMARQDEDGFYWFVGRKKDIIIRGGSNIAPAEVEEAFCSHPDVYEAGVIGIPDQVLGQRVRAFVALKPHSRLTEEALLAFVAQRIAAYKVPERIVFLKELPKGATGKVYRKGLREWNGDGASGDTPAA